MFFGCICQMLKLTFADDIEALLSQLPNNPLYWLTTPAMKDAMMKIVQFLFKTDMPKTLINMKTRIWGCYRKRVLYHIDEMFKHVKFCGEIMSQYGRVNIDKEMHCACNITIAHFNMKQVVRYLTLTITIGHVHTTFQ